MQRYKKCNYHKKKTAPTPSGTRNALEHRLKTAKNRHPKCYFFPGSKIKAQVNSITDYSRKSSSLWEQITDTSDLHERMQARRGRCRFLDIT